ncbi:ParD-like family protein [Pseudomonas sp. DSP3-2-2]|uniref:ParD-like family protein n=1 Tax=unclassified Pseudomonas TaxID=196821 RepID=UPI003CEE5586
MGLVKISEQMHANIRSASAALSRSINAQAEHWMRVGMLAELHPSLDYSQICQMLIRAEHAGGTVLSAQTCDISDTTEHAKVASR